MSDLLSSLRVAAATMAVCVLGYTALILGLAQAVTPFTANGSLLSDAGGATIGSRLIAQDFTAPGHVWPRPSAAGFDAAAATGSNLSPANPEITGRAREIIARHGGASEVDPIPADLVTMSGAGLDPHISLDGALFQAERVAQARGVAPEAVRALIEAHATRPGGPFTPGRIVNVLGLNLALDADLASPPGED